MGGEGGPLWNGREKKSFQNGVCLVNWGKESKNWKKKIIIFVCKSYEKK